MNMLPVRELCEIRLVPCEASLTIQCSQENRLERTSRIGFAN